MKLKTQLIKYLENEPKSRERRNKNRAIGNLLKKNHPVLENISKELLTEIVTETLYLDRVWRLTLSERKDLRGNDYNGKGFKLKEQLEQETEVKLGYEVGYNQFVN